jgi:ABC-type spermidine/putrescine transport system permease subunit I
VIEEKKKTWVSVHKVPRAYQWVKLPGLKWVLLLAPLLYIMILMVFSMFDLFKMSLFDEQGFTLKYLTEFFSSPIYLKVLWLTLKTALLVTFTSLILAYPIAYLLVKLESKKWKRAILGMVLIPFWISLLVRTFAWTILLQDEGLINKMLLSMHLIDKPIPLLFNTTGVVIGMTHILLPYMIISLYSILEGIDQRLIQAAQGLGARPMKAFWQIFFPLSLPGVLSGSLLVFVLGLGYFLTPALLGGPQNMMISMLIQENISTTLNWNMASAIALVLLIVTLLLLFLGFLLTRKNPIMMGDV